MKIYKVGLSYEFDVIRISEDNQLTKFSILSDGENSHYYPFRLIGQDTVKLEVADILAPDFKNPNGKLIFKSPSPRFFDWSPYVNKFIEAKVLDFKKQGDKSYLICNYDNTEFWVKAADWQIDFFSKISQLGNEITRTLIFSLESSLEL